METIRNEIGMDHSNIVDVWSHNIETEIQKICRIHRKYPIVVFDTEYPGTVIPHPPGLDVERQPYDFVKKNIDASKLIQLGISFMDINGNMPSPSTWQFNIRFDLESEQHSEESIELLKDSGISFKHLLEFGITPMIFGYYFVISGLLFNANIIWVAFHGAYDFAYLIRALRGAALPDTFDGFVAIVAKYFPGIFDVKHIKAAQGWKGGLERLGLEMHIRRVGTMHQGGSDALLTAKVFAKIIRDQRGLDALEEFKGHIYGFNQETRIAH